MRDLALNLFLKIKPTQNLGNIVISDNVSLALRLICIKTAQVLKIIFHHD